MNRHPQSQKKAFTLIEVTVAIGIAAFGIVSLLGLMGVFMNSGRESSEDTVLSDIAKSVAADLRARPLGSASSSSSGNSLSALASSGGSKSYFSLDGALLSGSASAVYACTVTVTAKPEFNTVSTQVPDPKKAINLYEAKIEFSWPHPQSTFKKTFHINLARYAY
jgi:uncharacterized protein (TIGR02598 family)